MAYISKLLNLETEPILNMIDLGVFLVSTFGAIAKSNSLETRRYLGLCGCWSEGVLVGLRPFGAVHEEQLLAGSYQARKIGLTLLWL